MDIGLTYFPTHETMNPVDVATMAEGLGYESVFVTEHTHIPVSRRTPYPAGGDLPHEYWQTWDPFVACTAMATATSTLKVGTAICLVNQHDPIVLAKTVATLQHHSGGRFVFGVGPGWNVEEMNDHGIAFDERFAQMRERVHAMRAIWTQDEASYDGDHVSFEPMWSWPKPGHDVPVLVAGWGPTVLDRVMDYGDGWIPIGGRGAVLKSRVEELQARAADAGRGPMDITIYQPGPTEQLLEEYADAGATRVLCALPHEDPDAMSARIDRYAAFIG
ncbi:LLM class F420-dependent oxidoreductase [Euzebya rosea]|uniref:LLM class F420-dependent oxidoreductase n=1 Tax=Euzebya rosea TaxID=2052804 RepID=UPI000D3EA7FB|nr:LLM class F420-dependent oxidoreductase [Euzebya rosea]